MTPIKIPGGEQNGHPPRFWLPVPTVWSHSQVDNKTGASPNRNYVSFDGYHAFCVATHPFLLRRFFLSGQVVKEQLTTRDKTQFRMSLAANKHGQLRRSSQGT